jgi:hypothetical protein
MSNFRTCLILVFVAGCAPGGLPGGGDGGAPPDLTSGGGDLPLPVTCGAVAAEVHAWLAAHTACHADADCIALTTACGLDGQCGGYYNVDVRGAALDAWLATWGQRDCGKGTCVPCGAPGVESPACIGGACSFRIAGKGKVGDACASGGDCATGQCLTNLQSLPYQGGYCTIIDCDKAGTPCPTGSTCKPGGDQHMYCLKNCDPRLNIEQCRATDHYSCCGGPGPVGAFGWCAPESTFLCTAM